MGKTSILKNLHGFLAESVLPVFVSMQDAELFTSLPHFTRNLVERLELALDPNAPTEGLSEDLPAFSSALTRLNQRLGDRGQKLLIAIDEYENIDLKLGEGVFPQDLLATFRDSIQHHRQLIWLFAGSHEIQELKHGYWTSEFVSLRTVEVPLFTTDETQRLLTEPLRHSKVWAPEDPKRPRFAPTFWGDSGIARIHAQTAGWPHLVQLVAERAVNWVQEASAHSLNESAYPEVLDRVVVEGHNVFYELLNKECTQLAEWQYLLGFRSSDLQPIPERDVVRRALTRRFLVVEDGGQWRLRVPLMQRWLVQRGDLPWHGER